jgi:hypothetical protein
MRLLDPYENGKLEDFLHRWMKNHEHKNFWFSMFPERRYFLDNPFSHVCQARKKFLYGALAAFIFRLTKEFQKLFKIERLELP